MTKSEQISSIAKALLAAQASMGEVVKNTDNPYFNSKFAELSDVLSVALPALNKNGITLLQPVTSEADSTYVETMLLHSSGEWFSYKMKLSLVKNTMQELGSAISYARRYGLQSALGMRMVDEDGNIASSKTAQPAPSPAVAATEPTKPRSTFRKSTSPVTDKPPSTSLF